MGNGDRFMVVNDHPEFGSAGAPKTRHSARPARSSKRAVSRRGFLFAIVVLSMGFGDFASAAAQSGAASRFIRGLGDQAIATMTVPGVGQEAREARIRSLVSRGFDLSFIGRFALGRHWRRATAAQRAEYSRLFGEYVLKTYTARFGGYAGQTMAVLSERRAGTKDVVVSTLIEHPYGPPIAADWRVRTTGARYRIIDLVIEGVSMVVTQRSEFAAVIQRRGLQGLIDELRVRHWRGPVAAGGV